MRPVLLNRQEVDKRRAEERRQLMEEGIKIASRVDTLRETLANEEKATETYLAETLRGIQEEIAAKHLENETLDSQIRLKRDEWNQLMQPIDQNWMWFVKSEKSRIEGEVKENSERERDLRAAISSNIARERANEEQAKELDRKVRHTDRLSIELTQKVAEAKDVVAAAQKDAHKLISKVILRDKESKEREQKATEYEQHLALLKQNLDKEKEEMTAREFKVLAKELEFYSPVKRL